MYSVIGGKMISNEVTCKIANSYPSMLTRGKKYKVVDINENKSLVRIVCDNGRTRWFSYNYFDLEGKEIPMLIDWMFDDEVEQVERDDYLTWVEVSFHLSDGTKRWCKLITPELLSKILNQTNINPPGWYIPNIILVRSFEIQDVERVLRDIDDNGKLIEASLEMKIDHAE
jgi:hypothetical protein